MFNNKVRFYKKKKVQSANLLFVSGIKRVLLCVNILKFLILLKIRRKQTNIATKMFTPVFNYLSHDRKNLVITIKHRIYKQKLMQLQA